jgi:hypothetical protein
MNDKKTEQIATMLVAAFKEKTEGALLCATTQIAQCLNNEDLNGASMWQSVLTRIAQLKTALDPTFDAGSPGAS